MRERPFVIVDAEIQEKRDQRFREMRARSKGKRCQPPMVDRLQIVTVLVEYLMSKGTPFATARKSHMNRAVREWLNLKTANTSDARRSRRKQIGPDAVQIILKQVKNIIFEKI